MTGEERNEMQPRPNAVPGEGWAVVIYNNDSIEVKIMASQLIRHAGVALDQAIDTTLKAERNGSAIVTITTERHANEIVEQLLAADMHADLHPC
jgi:ATP-dependent Clp protease adapter protein ClpS